jgi:hypothetical protein
MRRRVGKAAQMLNVKADMIRGICFPPRQIDSPAQFSRGSDGPRVFVSNLPPLLSEQNKVCP